MAFVKYDQLTVLIKGVSNILFIKINKFIIYKQNEAV